MLEAALGTFLDGSAAVVALRVAAVAGAFLLGVRLLAGGGRTVDDRDRVLLEAARRHGDVHKRPADPALPMS